MSIKISWDKEKSVGLRQKTLITKLLANRGMADAKVVGCPLNTDPDLDMMSDNLSMFDALKYGGSVGSLMHSATKRDLIYVWQLVFFVYIWYAQLPHIIQWQNAFCNIYGGSRTVCLGSIRRKMINYRYTLV